MLKKIIIIIIIFSLNIKTNAIIEKNFHNLNDADKKIYQTARTHILFPFLTTKDPEIIQKRALVINYLSKNKIIMLKKFFFESKQLYELGELFSDNNLHEKIEYQIKIIILFNSLKPETQQFLTEIIFTHCTKK